MSGKASTSAAPSASTLFAPISDSESDGEAAGPSSSAKRKPRSSNGQRGDSSMNGTTNYNDYANSESDSDPDDPIIKTLPVFLTPALADSLALLQYPHRPPTYGTPHPLLPPGLRPPSGGSSDDRPASRRITARYKSKVGQLELSVPLEGQTGIDARRFNEDRATDLGRGIGETELGDTGSGRPSGTSKGGSNAGARNFEAGSGKPLQRMTMSGETIPDQTWYACAVLKDNEVHLTPLTRTMQMRPALNYLDGIDDLARKNQKRERMQKLGESEDEASGASDNENGKSAHAMEQRKAKQAAAADKKAKQDDLKTINVSVAEGSGGGGGSGGVRDAKTARAAASLFGPAKAAQDEAWVDLPFYDPETEEANGIYEKLFASKTDRLDMITQATRYLRL